MTTLELVDQIQRPEKRKSVDILEGEDGSGDELSGTESPVGTSTSGGPSLWPCDITGCGKMFQREADLRRHKKTAKGHSERAFACQFAGCAGIFTRNDALLRHQKSHHGGQMPLTVDSNGSDGPQIRRRRRGTSTPATTPPPMECSDEDGELFKSQPKGTVLVNAPKRANTLPSEQVLRLTLPELDIRMVSVSEPISESPIGFPAIKTFKFVDPNGKSHDPESGVKTVKSKPRKYHKRSKMEIRVQPFPAAPHDAMSMMTTFKVSEPVKEPIKVCPPRRPGVWTVPVAWQEKMKKLEANSTDGATSEAVSPPLGANDDLPDTFSKQPQHLPYWRIILPSPSSGEQASDASPSRATSETPSPSDGMCPSLPPSRARSPFEDESDTESISSVESEEPILLTPVTVFDRAKEPSKDEFRGDDRMLGDEDVDMLDESEYPEPRRGSPSVISNP